MEEEPLPDLGSLSDEELKRLIQRLTNAEQTTSSQSRIAQIDSLRAELIHRLRKSRPSSEL
jgi:hypothetical protein